MVQDEVPEFSQSSYSPVLASWLRNQGLGYGVRWWVQRGWLIDAADDFRQFLETSTLLSRLSEYAALVFLRKPKHLYYSVSGSARLALLANVPIICEDNLHFQELEGAVDLVPIEKIPERVREMVSNRTLREEQIQRQRDFVSQWRYGKIRELHRKVYDEVQPKPVGGDFGNIQDDMVNMGEEAKKLKEQKNVFSDSAIKLLPEEDEVDVVELPRAGNTANSQPDNNSERAAGDADSEGISETEKVQKLKQGVRATEEL
mmetsp:Transcript_8110/g.12856  ORF Transcript_8110/g.12856 Transcript_8110/m.12856 type:complete len:259 (+) Transcript_8110:508-1284(+)